LFPLFYIFNLSIFLFVFFSATAKFPDNSSYSLLAQLLLAQATEAHTSPLILLPVRQHIQDSHVGHLIDGMTKLALLPYKTPLQP
jgi:hypothetical protein